MDEIESQWIRVDNDNFKEGDLIWIQHKDCADTNVGYVVLKSDWSFMLNNRPAVYNVINWYIAVLKVISETEDEKE